MKLKEFIEELSKLNPELEVEIYTEDPYEDYRDFAKVTFNKDDPYSYYGVNVRVVKDCLLLGGYGG